MQAFEKRATATSLNANRTNLLCNTRGVCKNLTSYFNVVVIITGFPGNFTNLKWSTAMFSNGQKVKVKTRMSLVAAETLRQQQGYQD